MATIDVKTVESTDGISKEIDIESKDIVFNILQKGIYAFPIKSTIRELTSNAYDAIKEREVAKAILSGKDKVEDHYEVENVGGIYHSSGWDPDYYDPKWLSNDPNIYIYYTEESQKDVLKIMDNGVGLGKDRLIGYFNLNWSSKRTNKDTLGKWGLGSKVALSLNVDSFRVTTRYNGRLFKFDVYLNKIDSIIPPISNGVKNNYIEIQSKDRDTPSRVYWEPTTKKNGVTVEVTIKKFEKDRLFSAVEEQLMYVDNVKFLYKKLDSTIYTELDIKADILYQDDSILISDNSVYSKPHILIGTPGAYINYGYISFEELEIETRNGAVGLICDINDLEVTPSREAVIWSQKTRKAVLNRYKNITEIATNYVNDLLKNETDYLQWLILSTGIRGGNIPSSAPLLKAFSSIISLHELKDFIFYPEPGLSLPYVYSNKSSLKIRSISFDKYNKKIVREQVKSISELAGKPIYVSNIPTASRYKDKFILEEEGVDRFILINILDNLNEKEKRIVNSTSVKQYNIDIPDDRLQLIAVQFSNDSEDNDDADEDKSISNRIDHEAIRKLNKQIVVSIYNNDVFSTVDIPIADLKNIVPTSKDIKVFYGLGTDRSDMKTLGDVLPDAYIRNGSPSISIERKLQYSMREARKEPLTRNIESLGDIFMILVSKENEEYILDIPEIKHISNLIISNFSKSGVLTFSKEISVVFTYYMALKYLMEKTRTNLHRFSFNRTTELVFVFKYMGILQSYPKEPIMYYKALEASNTILNYLKSQTENDMAQFLYKSAIYSFSKVLFGERNEDELDVINKLVPNSLADIVDVITDINLIDKDLLKEFVYYLSYFALNKDVIDFLSFPYSYNTSDQLIKSYKNLTNSLKLNLIRDIFEEVQKEHTSDNI